MPISMYWSGDPKKPTPRQRELIQTLRVAIRTHSKAISEVDRIIGDVVDKKRLSADWREYLEAVRVAIQDNESLAVDEGREAKSDLQVFFQEMERRLSKRLDAPEETFQ